MVDVEVNLDTILADDVLMAAIEADDAANDNVSVYDE